MPDYSALDKTNWFIQAMCAGWFSRQELVQEAARQFPATSVKTLDGTIGQYWSDCVNPKWGTYRAIQQRGLKVIERGRQRRLVDASDPSASAPSPPSARSDSQCCSSRHKSISEFTTPMHRLVIDDAFIREWNPQYDRTENDEPEYRRLLQIVARDLQSTGTIAKNTFLAIWSWKGAMRVIHHVQLENYDSRYAEAFRRAASAPVLEKLNVLIGPESKLPGVAAPTGSTILHIMHPETMPIIDVRTVEALFAAGLISTEKRDLAHYEEFRQAIEGIRRRCPGWSLREIDRALFAYHKQVLATGSPIS